MRNVPIPLRQVLSADGLVRNEPDPPPAALGSFWVESNKDLQSRIVKYFKQQLASKPTAAALNQAYADMVVQKVREWRPDYVTRVLGGKEVKPDQSSPLSVLAQATASRLGVPYVTPFFRTETRKSMREIHRLSGPNALRQRIDYVLQDLCILPQDVPGRVLLLDDIYNLGASARVYSAALKQLCKADRVLSFNLAATRFNGGKDGWGYVPLHISQIIELMRIYLPEEQLYEIEYVVVDGDTAHMPGCPKASHNTATLRFLAPDECVQCPECIKPRRTGWWKRVFSVK